MSQIRCSLVSRFYLLAILNSLVMSAAGKCFYTECNLFPAIVGKQKCPEGYTEEGATQCVFGLFGTSYMCCTKDETTTTEPSATSPSYENSKCMKVKEKESSYVVALLRYQELKFIHFCGGLILSPYWVLTSGRCLFDAAKEPINANEIIVSASDLDLLSFEGSEQRIAVDKAFIHEDYSINSDDQYANIALLYLTNPLYFNDYVSEISLPPQGFQVKKLSTAESFGYLVSELNNLKEFNSSTSSMLQKFEASIIPDNFCSQIYKSEVEPKGKSKTHSESQICVTSNNNHRKCPSDLGGLLKCKSYACGVASVSVPDVHKEVPDIYTDLGYFRAWIEQTMLTSS